MINGVHVKEFFCVFVMGLIISKRGQLFCAVRDGPLMIWGEGGFDRKFGLKFGFPIGVAIQIHINSGHNIFFFAILPKPPPPEH